jgi:hypothetical protein
MVTGIRAPPRLGRYVRPVVDALDLRQVELELCRLPEVTAARIVEDDVGRPVEVHILATREKHPKQIVRDVQSVSMATFGLDIDRRVISVVQLEGGSGDEAVVSSNGANGSGGGRGGGPARVVIGGIDVQKRQVRCNVRVTLEQGGEEAVGEAEGSIDSPGTTTSTGPAAATVRTSGTPSDRNARIHLSASTETPSRPPKRNDTNATDPTDPRG